MTLSGPGLRTQHVRQERFRCAVAVQDIVLAALFEIHHELHRDARAAGPFQIARFAAIAVEIPGISASTRPPSKRIFCAPFHNTALPNAVQVFQPGGQRDEMIAGELSHLAGETHGSPP